MKPLKRIILGLIFCVLQITGEAILGLLIAKIRRASDVNGEGVFLFAFVKTVYVIVPFVVGFLLLTYLTKEKLKSSWISFILNLGLLSWTYYSGLIKKDSLSFIVGSLLTSIALIIVDNKINIKNQIKGSGKGASLQQGL